MLVAKDKIKSNIGEYFLYMFQIEDLLRACNFNKTIIESKLVSQYKTDDITKEEIKSWYFGLCDLMKEEKKESSGHLNSLTNKIHEVFDFHLYLLTNTEYIDYQIKFKESLPLIAQLKEKQQENINDILIILNAIYGIYLLKLKGKDVSTETLQSASILSQLLADLSKKFKEYEEGKLKIE